jgi:hypothetical protein
MQNYLCFFPPSEIFLRKFLFKSYKCKEKCHGEKYCDAQSILQAFFSFLKLGLCFTFSPCKLLLCVISCHSFYDMECLKSLMVQKGSVTMKVVNYQFASAYQQICSMVCIKQFYPLRPTFLSSCVKMKN